MRSVEMLETIGLLRQMGVARATFHADGTVASVEFAPAAPLDAPDGDQRDPPKSPKRMSATGGLVPRAVDEP
jgi:hypothetical protein